MEENNNNIQNLDISEIASLNSDSDHYDEINDSCINEIGKKVIIY